MDFLRDSLLDLLYELRSVSFPLTVGGGFGLFLKRLHLDASGSRTLFQELPQPRAANDLDLFIRVELLANHAAMQEMAGALQRLQYEVVPEAKFLQWKRTIVVAGVSHEVKVDFLVGPLCLEEEPAPIVIDGSRTSGQAYQGTVFVPHPFPYLLMKLSAFSDRKDDANRDLGRHHALDVYTLVGMLTEAEYERAKELALLHTGSPYVTRARRILADDFSGDSAAGILRIKEHPLWRPAFPLIEMARALREIFGTRA